MNVQSETQLLILTFVKWMQILNNFYLSHNLKWINCFYKKVATSAQTLRLVWKWKEYTTLRNKKLNLHTKKKNVLAGTNVGTSLQLFVHPYNGCILLWFIGTDTSEITSDTMATNQLLFFAIFSVELIGWLSHTSKH